jgi:diguanylate cyclase (GGDEF)-like protein
MGVPTTQATEEHSRPRDGGSPRGAREQALDVALRCFVDTVGADSGAVITRSPSGTRMLSNWAAEGAEVSFSWTSETLTGRTFDAAGALVEPGPGGAGRTAAVAAPFEYGPGAHGVLYAAFSEPREGDPGELARAAESYARVAGLCLDPSPVLAATLCAPSVDALTGCLNYAGLTEAFKDEVERSRRHGHRLSCCFIDLDGFKRVNDERGHLEGNLVLSAVGDSLRRAARRYDIVGRFGGDEFVVVLPETAGRSARAIANRLRNSVLTAVGTATEIPIEASIGVVDWDGAASAVEFLDSADRALRDAKRSGGGRVAGARTEHRSDGLLELTKNLVRTRRAD